MSMIYRKGFTWLDMQSGEKKMIKKLVNLFSRNPGLTLRQGQAKLKQKGLDISYETIRTYLKANNMNSTTLLLDLL